MGTLGRYLPGGGFDVLDLFAGPGGWDEGARMLGLCSVGVEIEPDACRTAFAAGHARIRADVAAYPTGPFAGRITGLVASPPCQAWSVAGKRAGKVDRPKVHALVDRMAAGDDDRGDGWQDPASALVAQPVRWVRDLRPEWVCLEQVPPVLGLWRHVGHVLRGWGYHVWVGRLLAADYGVPQTRLRALLIASRVRRVGPPAASHYDPRRGWSMFGLPWVSMAEALGWHEVDRPARTVCGDRAPRWAYPQANSYRTGWTLVGNNKPDRANRDYQRRDADRPAQTISTQVDHYRWELWSAHRAKVNDRTQPRGLDEPAHTIAFGHPDMRFTDGESSRRVTVAEAAILQGFRSDYPWQGSQTSRFGQVGNAVPPPLAAAVIAAASGLSALEVAS